jgi:hypothetical protein
MFRLVGWFFVGCGSYAILASFADGDWFSFVACFVVTFFTVVYLVVSAPQKKYYNNYDISVLRAHQEVGSSLSFWCKSRQTNHKPTLLIPTHEGWECPDPDCNYRQPYSMFEESLIKRGTPNE